MNNFMTLSLLANFPGAAAKMKNGHRVKNARMSPPAAALIPEKKAVDAQARRLQRLQHDWRMLASEWQALAGAIEQFEREFNSLEKILDRRWDRRAGINGGTRPTSARSISPAKDTNKLITCDQNQKL